MINGIEAKKLTTPTDYPLSAVAHVVCEEFGIDVYDQKADIEELEATAKEIWTKDELDGSSNQELRIKAAIMLLGRSVGPKEIAAEDGYNDNVKRILQVDDPERAASALQMLKLLERAENKYLVPARWL